MKRKSSPARQRRKAASRSRRDTWKKPAPVSCLKTPDAPASVLRPILGIGASAGGLEALELFPSHVPKTARIMPYRTHDARIDGGVITFADITDAKTLEAKLRAKQGVLEKHVAAQSATMQQARDKAPAEKTAAAAAELKMKKCPPEFAAVILNF